MKFIRNQTPGEDSPASRGPGLFSFLPAWEGKGRMWSGFWSVGSLLSIALNLILIIVLIFVAYRYFTWKRDATEKIVGGLYYNFILLNEATIVSDVQVKDTIPVKFDLPLQQETTVRLTEATRIDDAQVTVRTGGLNIVNAPADIILPEGTVLPVELDIVVPVDTTIPVDILVPVNIPMRETELRTPFQGLQDIVAPIYWWLKDQPDQWWQFIFGK